jgi:hypothetical protein
LAPWLREELSDCCEQSFSRCRQVITCDRSTLGNLAAFVAVKQIADAV